MSLWNDTLRVFPISEANIHGPRNLSCSFRNWNSLAIGMWRGVGGSPLEVPIISILFSFSLEGGGGREGRTWNFDMWLEGMLRYVA